MSAARERRNRQNVFTLIGALLASFGIVLVLVVLTVRPDPISRSEVDWSTLASNASSSIPLADPRFTDADGDWWANRADYSGGSAGEWYIGLISPTNQFVSIQQFTAEVSPDVAEVLNDVEPTPVTLMGTVWNRYDRSTLDDPGNFRTLYTVELSVGGILVVSGTADAAEMELVAQRALDSISPEIQGED